MKNPPRPNTPATPVSDLIEDLALLIRSRFGLIVLETQEDERAELLLSHLADRLGLALFGWTRTRGIWRAGTDGAVYGTESLARALTHVKETQLPALYQFRVLPEELHDPATIEMLITASTPLTQSAGAVVLSGEGLEISSKLRPHTALLELPPPTLNDFRELLSNILRDLMDRMDIRYELSLADRDHILRSLQGLTLLEAEKILTKAIVEDGCLSPDDIDSVIKAKRRIVEHEGLLEFYPVEDSLDGIAGLDSLKLWLRQRRNILDAPARAADHGLSFPRGILLVGVPGCGKSLCAKAVAAEWRLPLLRFDPSNLYSKYIGESEKNFHRAIRTATKIAPVILWIDELEKAFASSSGDEDGGTSRRILGIFLSWLQERSEDVFVVATANDVEKLPTEFIRKGRFDEIFFVDLPDESTRTTIFDIHLTKRGWVPAEFDVVQLVQSTEHFSGAEIEQVIVGALFAVFSKRERLTTAALEAEIAVTRPLAVTLAERIHRLRTWADGRVRPAH